MSKLLFNMLAYNVLNAMAGTALQCPLLRRKGKEAQLQKRSKNKVTFLFIFYSRCNSEKKSCNTWLDPILHSSLCLCLCLHVSTLLVFDTCSPDSPCQPVRLQSSGLSTAWHTDTKFTERGAWARWNSKVGVEQKKEKKQSHHGKKIIKKVKRKRESREEI